MRAAFKKHSHGFFVLYLLSQEQWTIACSVSYVYARSSTQEYHQDLRIWAYSGEMQGGVISVIGCKEKIVSVVIEEVDDVR